MVLLRWSVLFVLSDSPLQAKRMEQYDFIRPHQAHTVRKVIDFPRYSTKYSGENEIPRGIFRVVSRFSLHFVLYLGNFDFILQCLLWGLWNWYMIGLATHMALGPICRSLDFTDDDEDLGLPKSLQNSPGNYYTYCTWQNMIYYIYGFICKNYNRNPAMNTSIK